MAGVRGEAGHDRREVGARRRGGGAAARRRGRAEVRRPGVGAEPRCSGTRRPVRRPARLAAGAAAARDRPGASRGGREIPPPSPAHVAAAASARGHGAESKGAGGEPAAAPPPPPSRAELVRRPSSGSLWRRRAPARRLKKNLTSGARTSLSGGSKAAVVFSSIRNIRTHIQSDSGPRRQKMYKMARFR